MSNPESGGPVTVAQAQTVMCVNCMAQPGEPCTQPTDTGRRPVTWVHLARETAYSDRELFQQGDPQ